MKTMKIFILFSLLCFLMLLPSISYAQLTGIKYIGGTSPDYTTVESAINDLNSQGVGAGGVNFLICDGIYTENENLMICDVAGTNDNPVIFQPDVDANVEINITLTQTFNYGFRIHNSDYISFDGTPYGSSEESRNMRINGWRSSDDIEVQTIWISNGSDHCSVKNMIIFNEDNTDRTGWSMPVYFSTYNAGAPLVGMEDITLYNCEVIGGSTFSILMDGDPGQELVDFQIVKNDVHDFNKDGIYIYTDVINCNVEGNEIYYTIQGNTSAYGIRAGSASCSGTKIHHNYIHDLWCSSTAKPYGIFITTNSHHNLIYNNIIYLCPEPTVNKAYGIYRASTDYTYNEFYYNTIYMGGTSTISRSSYCFNTIAEFGGDIFKNNILINERTGGGNNHYAIKMKTGTFDESDFNFLTVNSDDPSDDRFVTQLGTTDYNTLADLQSAPGYAPRDENSLSGDPDLVFPGLHLNSTSSCIGEGIPITGITTDFDYDLRDETTPDIGADEFISNQAPVITYFFPEETAFSIEQNTEQLFSIEAEDPNGDSLFYFWYLDDIQQGENSNEFTYTFSDSGNFLVKALVSDGELADSTLWDVTVIPVVGIDDNPKLVIVTKLSRNYPNPFNPTTTIEFTTENTEKNTELVIYNLKGQKVRTLNIENCKLNIGKAVWDGTDENNQPVSSGIYLYHLNVNGKTVASRKMILLK